MTAVADSLAISPFKTRPSVVATVKLAYFVSNARLGSRMAIRNDSGDLSVNEVEIGSNLDAFVAEPMAGGAQLLEHRRAGDAVALVAERRRGNESTTACRGRALVREDRLARGLADAGLRRDSNCWRRAGSISAGGTQPSSSAESSDDVQPSRLKSASRIAPRTCGE